MRNFSYVAKLIKEKRLSHPERYSQTQLSKTLGYKNGQFISNLERGLCSIPLKGMTNFLKVLDITENELKSAILKDYEITLDYYLKEHKEGHNDSDSSSMSANA
jgi:transcriptional regulator with XRE-family HTH domain